MIKFVVKIETDSRGTVSGGVSDESENPSPAELKFLEHLAPATLVEKLKEALLVQNKGGKSER